jgi:hypothetical protein
MTTHRFTLKLQGLGLTPGEGQTFSNLVDEVSGKLYEAGLNDGLVHTTNGVFYIDLDRESEEGLVATVASAINDVAKAGYAAELYSGEVS